MISPGRSLQRVAGTCRKSASREPVGSGKATYYGRCTIALTSLWNTDSLGGDT
jgi:hypothetical protein